LSWELGVLIYRMLFGKYPFSRECSTKDMLDVFKNILFSEVIFKNENFNVRISEVCVNLISGLLVKDFTKRVSINDNIFDDWLEM